MPSMDDHRYDGIIFLNDGGVVQEIIHNVSTFGLFLLFPDMERLQHLSLYLH